MEGWKEVEREREGREVKAVVSLGIKARRITCLDSLYNCCCLAVTQKSLHWVTVNQARNYSSYIGN